MWMFCGKTASNRINRLRKRALRVLHCDYTSTFEELLARSQEIAIRCSNLLKLMVEVYEYTNFIRPSILSEFFATKKITYDLRVKYLVQVPNVMTALYMDKVPYRSEVVCCGTLC